MEGWIEPGRVVVQPKERGQAVEDAVGARAPGLGLDDLTPALQQQRGGAVPGPRDAGERELGQPARGIAAPADVWAEDETQVQRDLELDRPAGHRAMVGPERGGLTALAAAPVLPQASGSNLAVKCRSADGASAMRKPRSEAARSATQRTTSMA